MDAVDQNIVRIYKEKFNMLLEVVQIINDDHSIDYLMAEFEALLKDGIGVNRILVYTKSGNHWNNILASGVSAMQIAQIDVERDLSYVERIETLIMNDNETFRGFDAIIPLFHKFKPFGYVLVGATDEQQASGVSPIVHNLKLIQILCNLIVVFIENKKVQANLLHQKSISNELKLASRIQTGLIPNDKELVATSHTKVVTIYHPHQEVGGDYYDVMRLSPYSVGFCIADVSGKGISAALLMSNFQAMVRSTFTAHITLEKLVKDLNTRVCQNAASNDKFITFFVGRYNILTGRLSYINAGHLNPIVRHPNGETEELQDGCIGLGMLDFIPAIQVGHIKMHRGSRLVAFTDGLIELDEGSYVSRSAEDVKNIMQETKDISTTMQRISDMVDDNRRNGRVFDDVSVLGIEFTKKGLLCIRP